MTSTKKRPAATAIAGEPVSSHPFKGNQMMQAHTTAMSQPATGNTRAAPLAIIGDAR